MLSIGLNNSEHKNAGVISSTLVLVCSCIIFSHFRIFAPLKFVVAFLSVYGLFKIHVYQHKLSIGRNYLADFKKIKVFKVLSYAFVISVLPPEDLYLPLFVFSLAVADMSDSFTSYVSAYMPYVMLLSSFLWVHDFTHVKQIEMVSFVLLLLVVLILPMPLFPLPEADRIAVVTFFLITVSSFTVLLNRESNSTSNMMILGMFLSQLLLSHFFYPKPLTVFTIFSPLILVLITYILISKGHL